MAPATVHSFTAFLFGLVVGSFLNVCIHRIPSGRSIVRPPSSCPHCGERIRFYDNIPLVSYILLLGKCRSCRGAISLRYPVVELTTGLLSLALFMRYGVHPNYFTLLTFCASLLVVVFIDLDHKIIPDIISLPGIAVGLGLSLFPFSPVSFLESLLGVFLGGGALYLVGAAYQWLRGREGMGGGDIKLLAMIGAWLGWRSLPFIILISSFSGTILGGGTLLLARRKLSETIPFGPFLVLGTLLYLFFEREIELFWLSYLHLR